MILSFRNKILAILAFSFIFSCQTGDKYDDKIVKDAEGNYYHLEHHIGDTYFLDPIKKTDIDSLNKR